MRPDDYFILSKAHGGYGYYAILADLGLLPRERWENFDLPGCVERMPEYGIIAGCGALGHGLPMGVGVAYGLKLNASQGHVWCLMGDGECQEGTTWEALNFAAHYSLPMTAIIDWNGLQAMDMTDNVIGLRMYELPHYTAICDGHNMDSLIEHLEEKPLILMAKTVKGYGMRCAENVPKYHYRLPGCAGLSQRDH